MAVVGDAGIGVMGLGIHEPSQIGTYPIVGRGCLKIRSLAAKFRHIPTLFFSHPAYHCIALGTAPSGLPVPSTAQASAFLGLLASQDKQACSVGQQAHVHLCVIPPKRDKGYGLLKCHPPARSHGVILARLRRGVHELPDDPAAMAAGNGL
jgi:hypothetical protein